LSQNKWLTEGVGRLSR